MSRITIDLKVVLRLPRKEYTVYKHVGFGCFRKDVSFIKEKAMSERFFIWDYVDIMDNRIEVVNKLMQNEDFKVWLTEIYRARLLDLFRNMSCTRKNKFNIDIEVKVTETTDMMGDRGIAFGNYSFETNANEIEYFGFMEKIYQELLGRTLISRR